MNGKNGMSSENGLSAKTRELLASVSTATLTMQLLKRGLRRTWMKGTRPLSPDTPRIVGEAFTLRHIPMREDLATPESFKTGLSTRQAIEAMPPGRVVVVDGRGEQGCATLGDILVTRVKIRGGVAVVTDACVRDAEGVRDVDFPVFCAGAAAPPSITGLAFVGWEEPIGCGGVAVLPGDIIVGDGDGVVVIPRGLADEVAKGAVEQERYERFALMKIAGGSTLIGVYPPGEDTLAEYEEWVKAGEPQI
jgi:regulator of RNase E activity RraA